MFYNKLLPASKHAGFKMEENVMGKFIVMGLDGAIPGIIGEYVEKGLLKNFKRLINEGVHGTNVPFPSAVTPGNWASIASGAYPGTTGISDFSVHIPGEAFTQSHDAFSSDICNAELLWDCMSKQGHKVATINYPCSRPRKSEHHTCIGDNGMPAENNEYNILSPARLFVAGDLNPVGPYNWKEHEEIVLKPSETIWDNLPCNYKQLFEATVDIKAINKDCSGIIIYHVLIVNTQQGFKIIFSEVKDYCLALSEIGVREWSNWQNVIFNKQNKQIESIFRLRVVEVSETGNFQLYISPIVKKYGFSEPENYSCQLYEKFGPNCDILNISKLIMGWLDTEGLLDEFRMQGIWQAKAALELINNMEHKGVFTKWHAFDKFYHFFFHKIDSSSPLFKQEEYEHYEGIHKAILKIADDMLGIILDGMKEDTTLMVISDHGLLPSKKLAWVSNYLANQGYIKTLIDEHGNELIDWEKTQVCVHPYVVVWVNLIGREPNGCVKPEKYDEFCSEIVDVLRNWKDPLTQRHVLSEVIETKNAPFYGLWGERDGDIRIFTNEGYTLYRSNHLTPERQEITDIDLYTGDHGSCLPTTISGRGSELAFFAAYGKGIVKNFHRRIPIKPCDIVPTLCYLLNIHPPANCEGAVLYSIL